MSDTSRRQAIHTRNLIDGKSVGQRVCEALGLDPMITGRIVIDIPVRDIVRVYVEMHGTREVIEVLQTLNGVDIQIVGKSE